MSPHHFSKKCIHIITHAIIALLNPKSPSQKKKKKNPKSINRTGIIPNKKNPIFLRLTPNLHLATHVIGVVATC